jgi:hypothetical protein
MLSNILRSYPSDLFSYNKNTRTFVTEASTLGWGPGQIFDRLKIKSTRTGKEVTFSLKHHPSGAPMTDGGRFIYFAEIAEAPIFLHVYNS